MQLFFPMALSDILQTAREKPQLLPFVIPSALLGAGVQSYNRITPMPGELSTPGQPATITPPRFIPRRYDLTTTGIGFKRGAGLR